MCLEPVVNVIKHGPCHVLLSVWKEVIQAAFAHSGGIGDLGEACAVIAKLAKDLCQFGNDARFFCNCSRHLLLGHRVGEFGKAMVDHSDYNKKRGPGQNREYEKQPVRIAGEDDDWVGAGWGMRDA